MNGVIDSQGRLVRFGFCDFETDVNETQIDDIPEPAFTLTSRDKNGSLHRFVNSNWSLSETLTDAQERQKNRLKAEYLNDIIWTDGLFLWYAKRVAQGIETEADTTKHDNGLTYWQEGQDEYNTKKNAIITAVDINDVKLIMYNPIHT